MCALVQPTLVADHLAQAQGATAPGRRLGRVADEASAPRVLCQRGGGIISILDDVRPDIVTGVTHARVAMNVGGFKVILDPDLDLRVGEVCDVVRFAVQGTRPSG